MYGRILHFHFVIVGILTFTKEHMKSFLKDRSDTSLDTSHKQPLTASKYAVASAVAGVTSATVSNFLDVVKTRQQLAVADEIGRLRPDDKLGVWQVTRNFLKEAGVFRALFKGLHMRLMYSLPSGVLSMVIVEALKPEN